MGWTFFRTAKGEKTRDILAEHLNFESENGKSEIVDCAVKSGVAYIAMKQTYSGGLSDFVKSVYDVEGDTVVIGLVVLTKRVKDFYNFGYKDMTETMGPYDCDCPARILDLLSPLKALEGEYEAFSSLANATRWRRECRDRQARPQIRVGQKLKFATKLSFTDGFKGDEFQVVRYKKQGKAFRGSNGKLYRIPNVKAREYRAVG